MSFSTSTTVYGQIIIEDKIYDLLSQPLGDEQKKTIDDFKKEHNCGISSAPWSVNKYKWILEDNKLYLIVVIFKLCEDKANVIEKRGTDNDKVIPYSDRRGIGISRNFKAIIARDEIYRRVIILARYLSYTITKLKLNPTTFYFKIRYEYGLKNSQSITENRLFNEKFLIDLSKSMIKKLDNRLNYKIHYIAISASNFANSYSNLKTFSVIDYKKDLKYKALNENLLKVRDKYGVDIIRYASEELNG